MKGSNTLLNGGSKTANLLVSVFWGWLLLAEKFVVMQECESTCQRLKYCTLSERQVALIYWHMQYISSGTDCVIHDCHPLNHCTVRFRLSSPFDSRDMSGSLPTASAGVQFRKAQQVYQNLCCLFCSFELPETWSCTWPHSAWGGFAGSRPASTSGGLQLLLDVSYKHGERTLCP